MGLLLVTLKHLSLAITMEHTPHVWRERLGILICKLGTFTVKQSSNFQLEGVGSIRRQLHMIFHFVEIGNCEALTEVVKCRFGVGGCSDVAE